MYRIGVALSALVLTVGCGGEEASHITEITSNQAADGDVALDPVSGELTVTSAADVQSVAYGIDESNPDLPELRALLDFTRSGVIPRDADVRDATLEIFIGAVEFADTVPSLLELVSYPLSGPTGDDFDSPAITTQSFNVFSSDVGAFLDLDVTDAVRSSLDNGLPDVQVRLSLDPAATRGLIQIADDGQDRAPVLAVRYFF